MKFLEARQLVDRSAHLPAYPLRVALSGTLAPLDLYLRAHLAQHAAEAQTPRRLESASGCPRRQRR